MEAIRKSSKTPNVIVAIRIEHGFESRIVQHADRRLYLVEESGGREFMTALSDRQVLDWLSYHPARKRGAAGVDRERNERMLKKITTEKTVAQ